ncbi:response regulator [Fontimonas sp. SYSU GA230001]|uniref:response regulator transcription factor n=1 Tax=Fontimonas sp. SYSU GA230001 TaxID=3142450 RepID=UPI0032B4F207
MTTKRVLIADDEENIVVSLEFLLRRLGCDVSVARDGAEALRQAQATVPDLILLDVMMPGVSGYDVCQQLRADARFAGTRIVLLTAKGREAEIARGRALGADDYIVKPFSTRELSARIRALLGLGTV